MKDLTKELTEAEQIDAVLEEIESFKLDPLRTTGPGREGLIADGKIHSFSTHPKRLSDKAGWYVIHMKPDGLVALFGDKRNWGDRHEVFSILNKKSRPKSAKERHEIAQRRAEEMRKFAEEEAKRHAKAAALANAVLKAAVPASPKHPYLVRKHINAVGLLSMPIDDLRKIIRYRPKSDDAPLEGEILIVPMLIGGKISTFEMIDPNGIKCSLHNGARKSAYWTPRPLPKGVVYGLAEGMATSKTVGMATRGLCLSVGSCSNFGPVMDQILATDPSARFVVYVDLGRGQETAVEAAKEHGMPWIPPPDDIDGTDFNDFQAQRGIGAVRRWIENASK